MIIEAAIAQLKEDQLPIVYVKVSLKRDARNDLSIVKYRLRYYSSQLILLSFARKFGEDIVEEWDRMRQSDGTYKTIVILDAIGSPNINAVLEKFDVLGITGSDNDILEKQLVFRPVGIRKIPEFLRVYCICKDILDYE